MALLGDRVKLILLAGGRGERFWPKSTRSLPKQFLQVDGHKSLLRKTYERVANAADPNAIYVVTGSAYAAVTRREVPELPAANLIVEPAGRNTAPAVALAALVLDRVAPDSILVALPSDHYIVGDAKFHATLVAAVEAAAEGHLVTIGVKPTRPETGYGYIRTGSLLRHANGLPVHRVIAFTEKPDVATAKHYVGSGDHLWNSGVLVCQTAALKREIARHLPQVHRVFAEIDDTAASLDELHHAVAARFGELPSISLDYGILERSDRVVTVPAYFSWNDVGDWAALGRLLPMDDDGNAVRGEAFLRDSHGLLVDSCAGRLVVTIGANDLIVVDTPQAILICARDRAQEVRSVTGSASAFVDALGGCQLPEGKVINKPWGTEIWWAVSDWYVGKIIEVRAGHSLSLQYHERKHETLYVQAGTGRLLVGEEWHTVRPGSVFTIPPGTVHRLEAQSDVTVVEVSTPEVDDVVRLEDHYGRVSQP